MWHSLRNLKVFVKMNPTVAELIKKKLKDTYSNSLKLPNASIFWTVWLVQGPQDFLALNYSRMFDLMVQYPKSKEGFSFGGFLSHLLVFGVESNQAEQPASLRRSCCNLSRCLLEQVKLVLEQVFPGEEEGFCVVAAVVFSFCTGHLCPRWLPRSSSFLGCCVVGL